MYRRTRLSTITFVVVILSFVAVVFARQQAKFRSGVEVVLLDVHVVDSQGQPIDSLKAEDFTVSVDHKPRKIVSAQFIEYGPRPADRRANPAAGDAMLDALAKRPPAAARTVLIVFDEDSLDPGDGLAARKAAAAFLDRLNPGDRVGVATIPNLRSSVTLTTDRAEVRKAIAGVITNVPNDNPSQYTVGLAEALAVEQGDADALARIIARECYSDAAWESATVTNPRPSGSRGLPGDIICPQDIQMLVRQLQLQARLHGQQSIDALQDLSNGLSKVAGPKIVVFVSGGMLMPDVRSATPLFRLGSAFAAGQISLYTIYVERAASAVMARGAAGRPSPTVNEDISLERWGIDNATGAAGGTLLHAIGTLDHYFDQVASEISAEYLIGIEVSPEDRDGRPHDVQVKVSRPSVNIRARRQYVIEPEKPAAKRAEAAPASPTAHAARLGARTTPVTPMLEAVTPDLQAVLVRAGEFALDYEPRIDGLFAEEQYDQTLSKWKSGPVLKAGVTQTREDWFVDKQRRSRSDYLLARGNGPIAWQQFRDPFQVDGAEVRPRGRLAKLFEEKPTAALQQAVQIMTESARFNLGFGERNMDVPTLVLALLEPANRARFFFRKDAEQQINGRTVWQVSFLEIGKPTIFSGDLALYGTVWIEPDQGRVVRSTVRLNMDDADAEISVTYAPTADLGGLWVPTEVREIYTSDTQKLETLARYASFRIIKK